MNLGLPELVILAVFFLLVAAGVIGGIVYAVVRLANRNQRP
jgi:hypothetical protein